MKLKAAVVGLGNIGMGYDYASEPNTYVCSHANAFHLSENFDLVGGVDIAEDARNRFSKKFSVKAYPDVQQLMVSVIPDVVAISVPQTSQLDTISEVIKNSPRAIICEKPFGWTSQEANEIISLIPNKTVIAVNFFRRFLPGFLAIRDLIDRNELGEIERAIVWYTKGIKQNASHFVDLLQFYFGKMNSPNWIRTRKDANDPEGDFSAKFGNTEAIFLSAASENFSHLEMELLGKSGSIRVYNSGDKIEVRKALKHKFFPNTVMLGEPSVLTKNGLDKYQLYVADGLYVCLNRGDLPQSNSESAFETTQAMDLIYGSYLKGRNIE